jgi:hypothetical protein
VRAIGLHEAHSQVRIAEVVGSGFGGGGGGISGIGRRRDESVGPGGVWGDGVEEGAWWVLEMGKRENSRAERWEGGLREMMKRSDSRTINETYRRR